MKILSDINILLNYARLYIKRRGIRSFLTKSLKAWQAGYLSYHVENIKNTSAIAAPQQPAAAAPQADHHPTTVDDIFFQQFPNLTPMRFYQAPHTGRRLNIVTDSISGSSLFSGVATSLILGALIAKEAAAELRIITRIESPERRNFHPVLTANGIDFKGPVTFDFFPIGRSAPLNVGAGDAFLSTSWWTTTSLCNTTSKRSIAYILQEDERMFYPGGDEQLLCEQCLRDNDIFKIINTSLLMQHLITDQILTADSSAISFEPAFYSGAFFFDQAARTGHKKRLAFYARPGHPRNLFHLGLRVLDLAVLDSVIDPDEWDVLFIGTEKRSIRLGERIEPQMLTSLSWKDYAQVIRSVDLGLSLMSTPHPSYPPLDLAASGAVVVSNSYGAKSDLNHVSRNIILRRPDVHDLLDGLAAGVKLANDATRQLENYKSSKMERDWVKALGKTVDVTIERLWGRV
jgi:hypothetical protein